VKRLLLWDIDGTLISSGGAGIRALQLALRNAFGIDGSLAGIEFAGRTDPWIIREIFCRFAIAHTAENVSRCIAAYAAALPGELDNPLARVLSGVHEILSAATDRGMAHGLLTGNLRCGAQLKLTHHGLWHHFPFGAFADDSEHRNELGLHALRRARDCHGLEFPDVWVIGDTPHDIACGKAMGVRTLALATGTYDLHSLRAHAPTVLLENLADTEQVLRVLEGPRPG
jgi:phosphoglycolate phosphatase